MSKQWNKCIKVNNVSFQRFWTPVGRNFSLEVTHLRIKCLVILLNFLELHQFVLSLTNGYLALLIF